LTKLDWCRNVFSLPDDGKAVATWNAQLTCGTTADHTQNLVLCVWIATAEFELTHMPSGTLYPLKFGYATALLHSGVPKEPCIRRGPDPPIRSGKGQPIAKYEGPSAMSCAKMAEPIEMP